MRAVNLIPAGEREGASVGAGRSGGAAYAVMAVVAGSALLAFLYGRADHQISSRRSEAASLSAQLQRTQAQAGKLAPYTSFVSLRQQRVNAVSELVDSRFDWAHAIHEFGRVLPVQVSVSSLSGTIGGEGGASGSRPAAAASTPASGSASSGSSASGSSGTGSSASGSASAGAGSTVTSATPAGSVPVFTLTGCATSQPAVALMLDRLRLIDGVSSVTLQSSTKATTAGAGVASVGACANGQPAYSVQVSFEPLPTAAVTHSATTAVSSKSSASGSQGGPR
jgi:hypothetical protein